jgi:hypothetical protein
MSTHVDVGSDFSDAQLAETFMHHRVLIIPVVDYGRVIGGDHPRRFLPGRRRTISRSLTSLQVCRAPARAHRLV